MQLPNKDMVYISLSKLNFTSSIYTKKSYSKKLKENYVNQSGYSSPTKYLIWVSQYTLSVNVFKGQQGSWKLVRRMPCVIGKDGKTSTGTFRLCRKDYAYGGVGFILPGTSRSSGGIPFTAVWMVIQEVLIHMDVCVCRMPI